jgi:hypothetical protein
VGVIGTVRLAGFATLTLGINFQKASCTLDGCVKVWTSRVDSVATETGKLLSGLAGGGEFSGWIRVLRTKARRCG